MLELEKMSNSPFFHAFEVLKQLTLKCLPILFFFGRQPVIRLPFSVPG
jgi:hypothetical protein